MMLAKRLIAGIVLFFAVISISSAQEELFDSCRSIIEKNGLTAERWDAATLNKLGYILYTREQYEDAAELFRGAVALDDAFVLPHYNLACMLSLQYGQGKEIEMWELFTALNKSILMDPSRKDKIKTDSDLDAIRHLERFQELTRLGEIHEKIARFDSVNAFEGSVAMVFRDEAGEPVWIHHSRVDFKERGFYEVSYSDNSIFPIYTPNVDYIGKPFRLHFTTKMIVGEFSGEPNPSMVLLDIERVK